MKQIKWAIVAGCLVGAAILGQRIYHAGYTARVAQDMAERTKVLQDRIATMEAIKAADEARADRDAKLIADLERRANETPANNNVCLNRAARDRVSDIAIAPAGSDAGGDTQPAKPSRGIKNLFRSRPGKAP